MMVLIELLKNHRRNGEKYQRDGMHRNLNFDL